MSKFGMVFDMTRCAGCQTCVVACQLHNNLRPGIAWTAVDALEWGAWPDSDRAFIPHGCMNCEDPACVAACPTGASFIREDGIVEVDYEKCIGCWACVEACPFGARKKNDTDVWFFDATEPAPYEAIEPRVNVAEKCISCFNRTAAGEKTWCEAACPTDARIFGDLDDPDSEISKYIAEKGAENVAATAAYYVKGDRDFDLMEALLGLAAKTVEKDGE